MIGFDSQIPKALYEESALALEPTTVTRIPSSQLSQYPILQNSYMTEVAIYSSQMK